MKYFLAALLVAVTWLSLDKVVSLASENQRLRLFNAREVRRFKKPAAVPRYAEGAEHILGTPFKVTEAVWKAENGPPDIETGVLGKTDYFSKNSPMDDWPALETARTMNIYAWSWMMNTPEGKKAYKQVLKYAAKSYTGNTSPETWEKNVYNFTLEK